MATYSVRFLPAPTHIVRACVCYLQVSVHDAVFMQVADSLQHLLDDFAGVPLGVDASVQNAIKQLTARHSVCGHKHTNISTQLVDVDAAMLWRLKWVQVQRAGRVHT